MTAPQHPHDPTPVAGGGSVPLRPETAERRPAAVPASPVHPDRLARPSVPIAGPRRKAPLGWLPWALLGALAATLLLVLLLVNAVDDDGPEGPAGDALGQVSGEDGESPAGSDGEGSSGGGGAGGDALARLSEQAVVGGAAVQPGPARDVAQQLAAQPGTAGVVLFAEGSAEIDAAGQEVVASAVAALKEAGVTAVEVVGHTDVIAGDPVNDTLSQERADAVAAALGSQLPGVAVTTAARGQDEPVAPNETEDGRQLNRRAVITARG